ncbi:MAG: glycosyltransferase [Nanoarchaeota archaeon]|nr:glycosyltransferase [Nanoarchaeota archaeon]
MKICVIHRYPAHDVLGTNASFVKLLEDLSKEHNVDFISFKDDKKIKNVNYNSINLSFRRDNHFDKIFKSLLFVFVAPFKVLRKKYDVIYCDDNLPIYWYFVKKFGRTKTLLRIGDLWGLFLQEKRFPIYFRLPAKILYFFEKKIMWKSLDGVLVLSNALRRHMLNIGVSKVKTITECIDLRDFENIRSSGDKIINHGFFHEYKKTDTMIKAIPNVLKRYPKQKFIFAGDGPELSNLKKLAKKLNIEGNVEFTGWLRFDRLLEKIKESKIGVTCRSKGRANDFVVTTGLLQDMVSGLSVLAPNTEATKDFINGKNGLIYNVEDSEDLANKIIYLLDNEQELKKMSEKAKEDVKKYDKEIVARGLKEAIENV